MIAHKLSVYMWLISIWAVFICTGHFKYQGNVSLDKIFNGLSRVQYSSNVIYPKYYLY